MATSFGNIVYLDSATGHKHPHVEILDALNQVLGYSPIKSEIDSEGAVFDVASKALQTQLLEQLKLANAPNGYKVNELGEVTHVLRLVDGVIETYPLVKSLDGTTTIYTPGAWA